MPPRSKDELEHELETLKLELDLVKTGLTKGLLSVVAIIIALSSTLAIGAKASILNGNQYVAVVAIVVFGLLIYFAFVFSRELKLKAKISEKAQEIEMSAGKKAR